MFLAAVRHASSNHTDILCTLLFFGWIIAGVLALVSLIKPIVSWSSALIVAIILLVVWVVVC